MKSRFWLLGLVVGTAVGLVVGTIMTFLDWRLNPGGLFHNAQGTDWSLVTATAASWFVPVAALVSALAMPVLYWLRRPK